AKIYERQGVLNGAVGLPVARAGIDQTHTATAIAAYLSGTGVNVSDGRNASRALLTRVTARFFQAMQIEPAPGRSFGADDVRTGAAPVAIISDTLWLRLFNRSEDVLTRPLVVDGASVPIIGVMPAGFSFPDDTSIWTNVEREGPTAYGSSTAHNFT